MSATLCLSFDNLGEAAEIGAGALAPDAPQIGSHPTATEVLPRLLDRLDARGLVATFFIEGLNAEVYPESLQAIQSRGHEVAYHAWAHEPWESLSAAEQAENLDRGLAAFEGIGIELAGFRPPGGGLGKGGTAVLHGAGLRYCSPAGRGGAVEDEIAMLPFQWRHVDATSVLPQLATVREDMVGSGDPLAPAVFSTFLEAEIEKLRDSGGFTSIVLHPFMLDWLGEEHLESLLSLLAREAEQRGPQITTFHEAANRLAKDPGTFGPLGLDSTGWS